VLYSGPAPWHAFQIMKRTKLEQKSYDQLRTLAAKAGIRGRSRMRKQALVTALSKLPPTRLPRAKARRSIQSRPRALKPQARLRETTELPASYGRTRLVLLDVDPHLVHAYWEVTASDLRDAATQLGEGMARTPWILRFYEIRAPGSGGGPDQWCFDVPVDLAPGNWYVHVPGAGTSYRAELGPASGGRFHAACRSNLVKTARTDASPRFQPKWLEVRDEFKLIRRDSESRSEPLSQGRTAAGRETPVARERLAPPPAHQEVLAEAGAMTEERAAAREPYLAPAVSQPSQDASGARVTFQSGPPSEDLSSVVLGDPRRKSGRADPTPRTRVGRSD